MAFGEVVGLIHASRQRSVQAVNTELIDLYWRIGQFLHHRIDADGCLLANMNGLAEWHSDDAKRLIEAVPVVEPTQGS